MKKSPARINNGGFGRYINTQLGRKNGRTSSAGHDRTVDRDECLTGTMATALAGTCTTVASSMSGRMKQPRKPDQNNGYAAPAENPTLRIDLRDSRIGRRQTERCAASDPGRNAW